ncbi:hypothetical protein [Janthinobacterium sp. NKUCC08_JDC]|uniref:hypothetical protein n=1 Tax=Janthinobacterium sp. NKUCC08_JDC TaxID=2842122 RepID=UPI001C5AABC5|nr:hypothetical protein [Janthinobacterium sp. NKUCC08_JDC]MBW3502295.1 hypothetical protein [Janthinobacterium sp. NKUCC08_JDC]
MSVTAAFHRALKEKETWEVVERQAPLLADKATLAGETTDDLLAIEIRQHTTKRHLYQTAYNL